MEGSERIDIFMIEFRGRQIGMIQACQLPPSDSEPASCGIDLLVGKKDLVGRGLGTSIINAFVADYVFATTPAEICTADPDASNGRSIRAFEKAGFRPVRVFLDHERPHILLIRTRTAGK